MVAFLLPHDATQSVVMPHHQPLRCLCSDSQNLLCIPSCTTNFSRCIFSFNAPTIWNELPAAIRESNTNTLHLRWLPVNQHINFKLATLTHNTLNSSQPAYLHSLLSYHTPARSLRSSNTSLLSAPRVHTTFASRSFSVAAPSVWNSLPVDIRACSSPHTFRRLLKTHCLDQAFSSP